MDQDAFWQLAEAKREEDDERFQERLVERLTELEPEAILAFHRFFARCVHTAYRFDLMAVSNIVNGNAMGEDYDAFVGWLVSRGRQYFEAAIAEPVRAADGASAGAAKSRALWRAPAAAYSRRTGRDDFELEAQPISLVMEGDRLTSDEVKERFGALVQRFGWSA